jgi:hypothetical protein
VRRNIRHQPTRPKRISSGEFLLRKELRRWAAVCLGVAALLSKVALAELCEDTPGRVTPTAAEYIFTAAISSDYGWGKSLRGWEAASLAVQATLAEWQQPSERKPALTVLNPSPARLRRLLEHLPVAEAGKIQVIYLAAKHTHGGAWQFTKRADGVVAWADLLQNVPPSHPCRIVILDVCHAAAVAELPVWIDKMGAAATLLASGQDELTWELDFSNRQPVDLTTRFPVAAAWLKHHLPATWDGRLSYLGLIWVQVFLQTPQPPQTASEWKIFFGRCEAESRRFQKEVCRQRASTIRQFSAVP